MQEAQETWVQSVGREDLLEKEMAAYSSILVWENPWTQEPGMLQSIGPVAYGNSLSSHATEHGNNSV